MSHPTAPGPFFIVEVHDTLGRPLLLLKFVGVQSITWRVCLLGSTRHTCPNHLSRRSLMIDSRASCPVFSRTDLFVTMSLQLIFRIFLCHLWWEASSFFVGHVSAPYNSVDKTKATYNRIFVCVLRPLSGCVTTDLLRLWRLLYSGEKATVTETQHGIDISCLRDRCARVFDDRLVARHDGEWDCYWAARSYWLSADRCSSRGRLTLWSH